MWLIIYTYIPLILMRMIILIIINIIVIIIIIMCVVTTCMIIVIFVIMTGWLRGHDLRGLSVTTHDILCITHAHIQYDNTTN